MKHLRDTYITIFGIKPVLEALELEADWQIDKVLIAHKLSGPMIATIERLCRLRGVVCRRADLTEVNRLSKHPKQDQGVVADVLAPKMRSWEDALASVGERAHWLALEGVTTPANVGLVIRSCAGLGPDALVLPRHGTAKLSPMVVKASAGTIFKAPLVKCERLRDLLEPCRAAGFKIYGLAGGRGPCLYELDLPPRALFILGNETQGVQSQVDTWLQIPMFQGVESLNVACAATVVAAEIGRHRRSLA